MGGIHVSGSGTIPVKRHPDGAMVFTVGGGWGDRIRIDEWPKKNDGNLASVSGHKNPKPQVGDILRVPCKSGKIMRCKFVAVQPCGNPADMFFADIEAIEYELDNQEIEHTS